MSFLVVLKDKIKLRLYVYFYNRLWATSSYNHHDAKIVRYRVFLLSKLGGNVGKKVNIQHCVTLNHNFNHLSIGANSGVGTGSTLHLQGKISIGNDVMIGQELIIHTSNHGMENNGIPMCRQLSKIKGVTIGDNVWIGSRVTILPGVNVGNGVVIGAGSIVTKNLESNGVYVGNPAKLIKKRS
jgi:maltose O-acetyltransferase